MRQSDEGDDQGAYEVDEMLTVVMRLLYAQS